MTSTNDPPGGPTGPGARRPPTIDLTAKEVAIELASAGRAETGKAEADKAEASRETAPETEPPRSGAAPRDISWLRSVAAGVGGAVVTVALLAFAGVFSARDSDVRAADPRLTRMEQQLRELAARPVPVAGDTKAFDDLAGRLARLETIVATPKGPIADPALANRIATLEGDLKALSERVGVLGRRNDEIASAAGEARTRADAAAAALAELKKAPAAAAPVIDRKEIDALNTRVAALERGAKALEAQLAGRSGGEGADRSLRLVVVANALNSAVERGAPFVAELATAKAAAPDPKLLAALDPFASAGVPSANTLARELAALLPALAKAVGTPPREGSILDRLRASAERIVQVRRLDEPAGDDPGPVLRRIGQRAEQGNLNGAMAEIAKLPDAARALTKEWIAKVEARNAAIEASQRFAAAALASIAKPSL